MTTGALDSRSKRPDLYVFAISHYCEKARWALDFLGVDYRLRHLAPGPHVQAAKELGAPETGLPFLVHEGQVVQGSGAIIDWADVPVAQHWLDALGDRKPPCVVYQAGGGRTLESDQAVVDAIRDASNDGSVAVLTKGFEPPLLELDDFLDALRKAIGQQRDIIIVPLDAPGRELPQAHRQRWQHMVENRRDAKLHLADVGTGPTDD